MTTATAVAVLAAPGTAQATVSPAVRVAAARAATAAVGWTSYTVRPGDTLSAIAHRTGTTTGTLTRANGLTNGGHLLRVGQRLQVPTSPTTVAPAPSAGTSPAASTRRSAGPQSGRAVRDLIARTARRYGVDPQLAIAIGYQESGWRQSARSSVGAIGTMQVMPANRRWLSSLAGRDLDLTVTEDNVLAGVLLLRHLVGNAPTLDHAIGAYYQGLPSILRRGAYRDTSRYISSVKALMRRL